MSIENLEAILRPAVLETSGVDWHEHKLIFNEPMQPRGDYAIQVALQKIFSIRGLDMLPPITCWYDVLRDWGDKSHYLHLKNVHMMGVLYKEGPDGSDQIMHFFIRKLDGYWGPLDRWKDDLRFPAGTRKYSVLAVFPQGFEMPPQGLRDPHNHAVTQISWERLEALGVSMPDILDYITYAGFSKD